MKLEYRVVVEGGDYLGFNFLENCVLVAKQGGVLDTEQVRMAFPQSAVFFLESDKELESTAVIQYLKVAQSFTTVEELEALSIDEFKNEMKKVGIKTRNRSDATIEYESKFNLSNADSKPKKVTKKKELSTDIKVDEEVAD